MTRVCKSSVRKEKKRLVKSCALFFKFLNLQHIRVEKKRTFRVEEKEGGSFEFEIETDFSSSHSFTYRYM